MYQADGVVSSSGSGKTESFTSPAIDSAIEQGWTCFVYDMKGTLMQQHAPYAASRNYDVYVFARGLRSKNRLFPTVWAQTFAFALRL